MYDFHRGFGEECLQAANLVRRSGCTFPHCLNSRRLPAPLYHQFAYVQLRSASGPESQRECTNGLRTSRTSWQSDILSSWRNVVKLEISRPSRITRFRTFNGDLLTTRAQSSRRHADRKPSTFVVTWADATVPRQYVCHLFITTEKVLAIRNARQLLFHPMSMFHSS